jgi:hypothetical protein
MVRTLLAQPLSDSMNSYIIGSQNPEHSLHVLNI